MSFWTSLRDGVESAASIAGNYFVPGSSLITSHLTSQGSQDQLNSTLGRIAQVVSGAAGTYNLLDSAGKVIGTTDAAGASQAVSAGATDSAGVGAAGTATGTSGGLLGTLKSGLGAVSSGAGLLSAIGGVAGAVGGSKQSGTTTTTQQQTIDPRMAAYLYGDGTSANPGLLSQIAGSANQPRAAGSAAFGGASDQFIGANGGSMLAGQLGTANDLQHSAIAAPQGSAAYGTAARISGTPTMQAAASGNTTMAAPAQNKIDLSGAYSKMINGDSGANPYLTRALQSAVDQTNAAYAQNQTDLTNSLTRTVLPQIGANAVLAGQYGGSRQGIAEGNALSDYTKQLTNANLQLGLANSANTTGQQAAAYSSGQDRSLSALNSLSGQQYGAAATAAQLAQQNSLANAGFQQAANAQNAAQQQQTALANAGFSNQANLANAANSQQMNLANMQAKLGTNQLNSANQATGLGASSSLLGQANQYATTNDQYGINRNGQVASQLAPFTGLNSAMGISSPLYSNPIGNVIGGATAGLGLYNAYNQATNNAGSNALGNFASNNADVMKQTGLSASDLLGAF